MFQRKSSNFFCMLVVFLLYFTEITQGGSAMTVHEALKAVSERSTSDLEQMQIYAVTTGFKVSFSSDLNNKHHSYFLDTNIYENGCWQPSHSRPGEWIQVSSEDPKIWTGVIIQGRSDRDEWVSQLKVSYTLNGRDWTDVGYFYPHKDRNTKSTFRFKPPVYARVIRIYPQKGNDRMALRFDAMYLNIDYQLL